MFDFNNDYCSYRARAPSLQPHYRTSGSRARVFLHHVTIEHISCERTKTSWGREAIERVKPMINDPKLLGSKPLQHHQTSRRSNGISFFCMHNLTLHVSKETLATRPSNQANAKSLSLSRRTIIFHKVQSASHKMTTTMWNLTCHLLAFPSSEMIGLIAMVTSITSSSWPLWLFQFDRTPNPIIDGELASLSLSHQPHRIQPISVPIASFITIYKKKKCPLVGNSLPRMQQLSGRLCLFPLPWQNST